MATALAPPASNAAQRLLLVPGGWYDGLGADNHCVLVVEVLPSLAVQIALVNAGEGGIYHPSSEERHPKLQRQPALVLGEVPRERECDAAFLATLRPQRQEHECHKVDVMPDALLPWLVQTERRPAASSLAEEVARTAWDEASDWRTPARSKTTAWKSLVEASGYVLRRRGVGRQQLRQLALKLRRTMLGKAFGELRRLANPEVDRKPEALRAMRQNLRLLHQQQGRRWPPSACCYRWARTSSAASA